MKRAQQEMFEFPKWGGRREGAGRKGCRTRRCVPHVARSEIARRHPVHVTLRVESGFESLRKRRAYRVVLDSIAAGCSRFGLRIVQYAVMTNHVHMVCEAEDATALSRGIKGLGVRLARRLNALWRRTGRVFADRYHARALKTPREVRNALAYLLHNASHHGHHFAGPDPCSSGIWFDGWDRDPGRDRMRADSPLPRARSWLLAVGWRRHGPIALVPP